MILHGLRLQNWRNIESLELNDLNHDLVVLHGPNRTGKSGIVLALRYGLFDFDHSSSATAIKSCSPRRSQASPEVEIDFEVDEKRYRLHKVFSTRRDGEAWLKEITATGEAVLERDKEAGRQARMLLGAEKSSDGLNELLWLTQGEVRLPDANKLSSSLQQRLEAVLGTLLTSHDWAFHDVLRKAADEYFTRRGNAKTSSPVMTLQNELDTVRERVGRLRLEQTQSESLVSEHEGLETEIQQARESLADAEKDVTELESQSRDLVARQSQHEKAKSTLTTAERELETSKKTWLEFQHTQEAILQLERETLKDRAALENAQEQQQRMTTEFETLTQTLAERRQERETLAKARTASDEREKLLNIYEQQSQVTSAIEQVKTLEQKLVGIKQELQTLSAPDKRTLESLRKNSRAIGVLQAEVDAAALQLEIQTNADSEVKLTSDDDPTIPLQTTADDSHRHVFRQRLTLRLPGWGEIRVVRGQQDESLADSARRLAALQTEYADTLRSFGLEAGNETALDELAARQTRRDSLLKEQAELQQQLQTIAPDGQETLELKIEQLERGREAIWERLPELREWLPNRDELAAERLAVSEAEKTLQKELQRLETTHARTISVKDEAEEATATIRLRLAQLTTKQELTERRLQELGSESALKHRVAEAEAACKSAREAVEATALTKEELEVESRLIGARRARELRRERIQSKTEQAAEIRGRLQQKEGLHEELATAEAELHRLEMLHREKSTDAEAHQLLLKLFESCRDQQVGATTGRIASQVMQWSHRLGLGEYEAVEFEKGYLPQGMRLPAVETPVSLDDESYGTLEQLALLVRLAVGRLVAGGKRHVALLDDPLTHADTAKHRRMVEILQDVAAGHGTSDDGSPISPLQVLIFTCHPERFDYLTNAKQIDLKQKIQSNSG